MDKQRTEKDNRFILPSIDATEIECYGGCIWISQYETTEQKQMICIPVEYLGMFAKAINKALAEAG